MSIHVHDKGDRAEREVVQALRALGLVDADRAYGAGRCDDRGDIDGLPGVVAQVKWYADGWRAVREGVDGAVEQAGRMDCWPVALVRYPRKPRWLWVMTLEDGAGLYRQALEH